MQPYLFPYVGYWQLLAAVDCFVIYDDVNFIKKGWINRNQILLDGKPHMFTLPIANVSQHRHIREHEIHEPERCKPQLLQVFRHAYRRAPQFDAVFPLLERIVLHPAFNISEYIANSLLLICEYLQFSPRFVYSSEIEKPDALRAQEKIIDICQRLETKVYINPIGGMTLYDREAFERAGMSLYFIRMEPHSYPQFGETFQPNLSIIDLLMFQNVEAARAILQRFQLI